MKIFVTILLLMMSFSFIAENVFQQKYSISQVFNADEDSEKSAEQEQGGKKAEELKEKYYSTYHPSIKLLALPMSLPFSFNHSFLSSGYINKPYTPPDFA